MLAMNCGDNSFKYDKSGWENATFSVNHVHYHHCCHNDELLSRITASVIMQAGLHSSSALNNTNRSLPALPICSAASKTHPGLVCVCVFELSDGSLTQIRLLSIQHTGKDLSHSTSAGLCCSILHVISKGLYLF